MAMTDVIERKLNEAFTPSALSVVDDSESHRGHSGHREGEQTHFNVMIRSTAFEGLNRVAQQRAIYKVLDAEMKGGIHALALDVGI